MLTSNLEELVGFVHTHSMSLYLQPSLMSNLNTADQPRTKVRAGEIAQTSKYFHHMRIYASKAGVNEAKHSQNSYKNGKAQGYKDDISKMVTSSEHDVAYIFYINNTKPWKDLI